ncbi:hypothetical protein NOX90_04290 [Wolbachia endosymbiont of Anurida maritima]|uniref:hypothetical protein n=1 Tax=Wolbachia endosymbiont of Anurida maritima TaxID=2850562 RepID=UPI0035D02E21
MPQKYDTITPENNISIIDNDFQVGFKNLIDKYFGSDGKSGGTAVEGDVQVEKHNQGRDLLSAS